jgi:hypothetical protein
MVGLFGDVPAEELAVRSSVESLGRIFFVVLALAIGEAFKQFVADKAEKEEDRHIHWDRVWSLVSFVALVFPFSHGMARYFFDIYQVNRPRPYAPALLFDSIGFTIEAVLFFVLSRSLPRVLWRRFYLTVLFLLAVDGVWGSVAALRHAPSMWNWVFLDIGAVAVFGLVLLCFRKPASFWGPAFAMVAMLARAVLDYWMSFGFYFPPQP